MHEREHATINQMSYSCNLESITQLTSKENISQGCKLYLEVISEEKMQAFYISIIDTVNTGV